jgi:hypothetical protein
LPPSTYWTKADKQLYAARVNALEVERERNWREQNTGISQPDTFHERLAEERRARAGQIDPESGLEHGTFAHDQWLLEQERKLKEENSR